MSKIFSIKTNSWLDPKNKGDYYIDLVRHSEIWYCIFGIKIYRMAAWQIIVGKDIEIMTMTGERELTKIVKNIYPDEEQSNKIIRLITFIQKIRRKEVTIA